MSAAEEAAEDAITEVGGGQSRRAWKDLKQVTIRFKQLLCSAERAEMFQTDANLDMCGTYNKLFNVF